MRSKTTVVKGVIVGTSASLLVSLSIYYLLDPTSEKAALIMVAGPSWQYLLPFNRQTTLTKAIVLTCFATIIHFLLMIALARFIIRI